MPIEFGEWLARLHGQIPDASVVVKPKNDGVDVSANQCHPLLVRMRIADLLVPNPITENFIQDWVEVFCVGLDDFDAGSRNLEALFLKSVIGRDDFYESYVDSTGDEETLKWFNEFRAFIKKEVNSS